jgi:hypothetical protein
MLKLERLSGQGGVHIRLKEKSFLFDAPFLRALGYSFLFHLVLFGVFKIEFLDIPEPIPNPCPVEVAVGVPEQSIVAAHVDASFDKPLFVESPLSKIELSQTPLNKTELLLSQLQYNIHNNTLFYETKEEYPNLAKEMSEPLAFQEKLYPLRLKLSSSLTQLKLVEDGSCLFKEKSPHHLTASYILTIHPLDIEYSIVVSGETGKVIEWHRSKELLDKKLQRYADKLIQTIAFAPNERMYIKGKVLLIFKCSGEEIENLVLKRI